MLLPTAVRYSLALTQHTELHLSRCLKLGEMEQQKDWLLELSTRTLLTQLGYLRPPWGHRAASHCKGVQALATVLQPLLQPHFVSYL